LTCPLARSKAHPQQCPKHGLLNFDETLKKEDSSVHVETADENCFASESAQSSRIVIPPRPCAAFTQERWFSARLWGLIRELAPRGAFNVLHKQVSRPRSWRVRPGNVLRFEELPLVLADLETSLHILRLLHALNGWKSRQQGLTSALKKRLSIRKKTLQSIRLALDSNRVQPDDTADTIFLFGQGFAEILKRNIQGFGSLKDHLLGPYCIDVLTHLITDINSQLAEDIDAVVPAIHRFTEATEPQTRSDCSSPGNQKELLSKLSPALRLRVRNGCLYSRSEFPRDVSLEQPRSEMWEALTSLIKDELTRPRRKSESQRLYEERRQTLLANAEWIRRESVKTSSQCRSNRLEKESLAKLSLMKRWRTYHTSRLKIYQRSRDTSMGTKRRIRQLQATVEETTRGIQHLRSVLGYRHPETEDENRMAEGAAEDSTQVPPKPQISLRLKPASLSGSMLSHLSRDLLDSLNEAAFTFGHQEASAMMQKYDWTAPETIDLPIFVSSFHLYPNLIRRFVGYGGAFGRLREFRNHHAHGSGSATIGDILLALDDVVAAAQFFRSPELAAKAKQYQKLLKEFTTTQNKNMKRAYGIIQPFKAKLKARLEGTKTRLKDVDPASDSVAMQSMVSEAAGIQEAWTHTEQSLLQLNASRITRMVGEAQIRRIVKQMGPDASIVLSIIQKQQVASSNDASTHPGIEEILNSLDAKLSHLDNQNLNKDPTKANSTTISSSIVPQGLTPELLDLLPSDKRISLDGNARQQKEHLRKLADLVRKKT
jgi:hypothetical protein